MDIHYNAFISYRHHPDDIKVAMEVHRALERYHIPRSLKKKLNVTGPMHLFRDKEELPITSNLNDDIGEALRNSDFLIVICSVHTKESIWVQREIELFMKSHHRSRVLTVLASGEPYDVIPEILLWEDRVDPVTGETLREMVEPLSCDWRIGRKRAMQEELPRLAAPLLGCAYDELRQRQKQYRMRRMMTLVSLALVASLGFSGYVLRNSMIIQKKNVEIQANLEAAQRNQSRHLATAAQERLAEGDRLTAISLVVAALPGEDNTRPYVPEAELALSDALGVYQEYTRTLTVGAVSPGSQSAISSFYTSPDGDLLYLHDMRKQVTVWDSVTMERLGTWDHSEAFLTKLIPAPGQLALVQYYTGDGDDLKCVKPDGTVVWQLEDSKDVVLSEEGDTVLVITQKDITKHELLILDLQTGKQLRKPLDLNVFSGLMNPWQFCPCPVSEGDPILIEYSAYPEKKIAMFDWQTLEHRELPEELGDYARMLLTQDGKLVAMSYGEANVFSGTFGEDRVNSTIYTQIVCYDMETAEKLWQAELTSSVSGSESMNELADGRILCQSGPVFQLMDPASGEILNRCEAGSSALTVKLGDGHAQAVLEDGHVCYYWYDGNYCYEEKSLQGDLFQASICGEDTYFSLQLYDNQVNIYREVTPPTLWSFESEFYITITDQRLHGDQWLFNDYDCLYLLDLQTRQLRWGLQTRIRDLLDFSEDGTKFWFVDGEGVLQVVDTATGETKPEAVDITADDVYTGIFRDGVYYYTTVNMDENLEFHRYAKALDLNTKQITVYELPLELEESGQIYYKLAGQWDKYLWIWDEMNTLTEVDLTTGDMRTAAADMEQCPVIAVNAEGTCVAMTDQEQVLLMAPGSAELKPVPMEADALAGGLYFYGSDLLVLCDNGYLYRYDTDGNLLSRTELTVPETFARNLPEATSAQVSWQLMGDRKLVVNAMNMGNVVDCENWKVSACVPAYNLYREADSSFVCNSYYSGIAAYPVYTTEELLQLAVEKLGPFSLTEEQKLAYGIE